MSFLMSKKKNSRYSMTLFESTLSRNESVMAVVPIYYAENVDSVCLLRWNIHILVTELPPIRHIIHGSHQRYRVPFCRLCTGIQVLATSQPYIQ